jgi:transposase InsO family protein
VDFLGPLGASVRNRKILFMAICDVTAYAWAFPQAMKTEMTQNTRALVEEVRRQHASLGEKVVKAIRTDNEAVFHSAPWKQMLNQLGVQVWHPVPYTPQQNGVIERFMRTLSTSIRACLIGVDHKLWCFAAEYVTWTWNHIPRPNYRRAPQYNGMSPIDIRRKHHHISPIMTQDGSPVDDLDEEAKYIESILRSHTHTHSWKFKS